MIALDRSMLVACLSVALIACQRGGPTSSSTRTVDSAGVRITTIETAPSAVDEWTVSPSSGVILSGTDTSDASAFGTVGPVRLLTDGRIVVTDVGSNRLLIFDSTGKYLRSLGRTGDGPGELRNVTSLSVLPGDSMLTFDSGSRRLSVWHPDRGFIRTLQIGEGPPGAWTADAWLWRDSLIVALQLSFTPREAVGSGGGMRRWSSNAQLTLHTPDGRIIRKSPIFDGWYSAIRASGAESPQPFSNKPFAVVATERVYFGSGASFSLSYLDTNFAWAGDIRWPVNQELLTSEEVNEVRSEVSAALPAPIPAEVLDGLAGSFSPEILPTARPAIGRVLVTPDGRLWVGRFEAGRLGSRLQKAADRWTSLSADGQPITRLTLPDGARLESIRNTRVALVLRDSLDVQTVVLREIVKR